jgi:hypothetical protein
MSDQPRYRLLERAYLPPLPGGESQVLPPDTEVVYLGKPGEHMEPLNDAAREIVEAQGGLRSLRPELKLSMSGGDGGEAGAMLKQSLGLDMTVDANVVAAVAQLLVRVAALEARVPPLPMPNVAKNGGVTSVAPPPVAAAAPPPPPPLPARTRAA